jgi:hypothetical protein
MGGTGHSEKLRQVLFETGAVVEFPVANLGSGKAFEGGCWLQQILRIGQRRINHLAGLSPLKFAKSYRNCWENRRFHSNSCETMCRSDGGLQAADEVGLGSEHTGQQEEPFQQFLFVAEGDGEQTGSEGVIFHGCCDKSQLLRQSVRVPATAVLD